MTSSQSHPIDNFLVANFPGQVEYLRDKIEIVDSRDGLILIHYLKQYDKDPIARNIRGWVCTSDGNTVVVKGEADLEDVELTPEILEHLTSSIYYEQDVVVSDDANTTTGHFVGIVEGKQYTHIRIFYYSGVCYQITHRKLDINKSHWGIRSRSFGEMLSDADPIMPFKEYNYNGCNDIYLECPDNQFVVYNDIVVNDSYAWNADEFVKVSWNNANSRTIKDDIMWIDFSSMTRYLSPSMMDKLHNIRCTDEPNIIKRFYYLKGSGTKLINIVPNDQKQILLNEMKQKNHKIEKLIASRDKFCSEPEMVKLNNIVTTQNIPYEKAFFKLTGIEQYNLILKSGGFNQ